MSREEDGGEAGELAGNEEEEGRRRSPGGDGPSGGRSREAGNVQQQQGKEHELEQGPWPGDDKAEKEAEEYSGEARARLLVAAVVGAARTAAKRMEATPAMLWSFELEPTEERETMD